MEKVDNDYFEIQQSIDANLWKAIGRIQGKGNSLSSKKYKFFDTHPPTGTIYYRLKQVDFDERYEYSNIVSVQFSKREILLFPNPASGTVNIISLSDFEIKNVIIYNQIGVKVLQVKVKNGVIDVSSLPKGVYIGEIKVEGRSISKQFIIR